MKKQLLLLAAGLVMGTAAADAAWTAGKDYYFDPSACSWYNDANAVTVIAYNGITVNAEKQIDGVCKFTLTTAPTGSITVQRKESYTATTVWNSITVNAPSNDSQNLIKSNSGFNGYTWGTYTVTTVTGTWSTTKDYYFNCAACNWLTNDGAVLKAWDGKSEVAMDLVEAGLYKFRLTNGGDNGYVVIRRCNPAGGVWNDLSIKATDDAAQNLITINSGFTTYTWGTYVAGETPVVEYNTIYFDNTSNWSPLYVYYWETNSDGVHSWPGLELKTKEANGLYKIEIPTNCTNVIFNNGGDSGKTADLVVVDGHVYTAAGDSGKDVADYEGGEVVNPGTGYAGWYLNVIGSNFKDEDVSGVELDEEGKATVKNIPVGTGTFEIKIWDGKADHYYSTGSAVALNKWTYLPSSAMVQMTIEGATADAKYDIAWDEATKSVYVTLVGGTIDPIDPTPDNKYAGWYLNVIGTEGEYAPGVELAEDGTATVENVEIGTKTFEIKIWNGTADSWYSNGGVVAQNSWVVLPYSSMTQMTIEGATDEDIFNVSWNQETTSVEVVKVGTTGVAAVEAAEAPVYFNLQGVKVANPENGLYIKVQGGKTTKVLVK